MLCSVVIPFDAPVTVGYSPTALLAWRDFKQNDRVYFGRVRVVVENGSVDHAIIVNVCTSRRGKPDEVYPLTVPAGEQRTYELENAAGLLLQLDAHTDAPGASAGVCFEVVAYDENA